MHPSFLVVTTSNGIDMDMDIDIDSRIRISTSISVKIFTRIGANSSNKVKSIPSSRSALVVSKLPVSTLESASVSIAASAAHQNQKTA